MFISFVLLNFFLPVARINTHAYKISLSKQRKMQMKVYKLNILGE